MNSLDLTKVARRKSNNLVQYLLDAVFPKMCLGCEREGSTYLCGACSHSINRNAYAGTCSLCKNTLLKKESVQYGRVCGTCRGEYSVDGVLVPFSYTETIVEKCIRALKYRGARELADVLAKEIYAYYLSIPYVSRPRAVTDARTVMIIPMPLHRVRELQRGFNQSVLIANTLSLYTGWRITTIVTRIKRTASQTALSKSERRYNMKSAFRVNTILDPNVTYIIVDDVVTSGISVASLAYALREKGAKKVWVMAAAHG